MKKAFTAAVMSLLITPCNSAWAETKTVTLSVSGMSCAACPITIKKALTKVDGVTHVEVSYERKDAVVSFDDAKTGVPALIEATTNAGYPSHLAQ